MLIGSPHECPRTVRKSSRFLHGTNVPEDPAYVLPPHEQVSVSRAPRAPHSPAGSLPHGAERQESTAFLGVQTLARAWNDGLSLERDELHHRADGLKFAACCRLRARLAARPWRVALSSGTTIKRGREWWCSWSPVPHRVLIGIGGHVPQVRG